MGDKRIRRSLAFGVFLVSFLVYLRTLAPTTSFWDCGEFITCSYLLGVPHPPGAPLYLLIGRLFSMIPFASDIGYRVNLFSALASGLTIALTFLTIVRFIQIWRGRPTSAEDRWLVYGSAVVGALSFAFTDTFWFNAVEAEVYAISMLFTVAVVYLALLWWEKADQPIADRYLLLIAYLFGLAIGVHLLNILAFPAIFLMVYFRKGKLSWSSLIRFGIVGLLAFWAIYPGIVKGVPYVMEKLSSWVLVLAVFAIVAGAYEAWRRGKQWAATALTAAFLVLLGYSTYGAIYLRSKLDPPIDENDPENVVNLVKYLNREQYGTWSIWDRRRWKPESACRNEYSGSLDFLWDYQIRAMYIRYFGWQYIGKGPSVAPAEPNDACRASTFTMQGLWAIPFLIGVMGMVHHIRRDWKGAAVVGLLFITMGVAIVLYLNQEDPQPRERDYVYVGSFYAFALWIGMGLLGFMETAREWLRSGKALQRLLYILGPAVGCLALALILRNALGGESLASTYLRGLGLAGGIFGLIMLATIAAQSQIEKASGNKRLAWLGVVTTAFLLISPAKLLSFNFHSHDRTGQYVPYDYSYNLLQSCEPNAIIFTNGDNDTFPVWFLQYVYKIRPDIRIVNLSLLNTDWYIKQLKYMEPKVPISLTDEQIEELRAMPWKTKRIRIPVPEDVYLQHRREAGVTSPPTPEELEKSRFIEFDFRPTLSYAGVEGIRVQDYMVLNIIYANQWKKPIYFAVTVSPENKIGLDRYLRMDGLDFKLVSYPADSIAVQQLRENLFDKFLYRNLDNPKVYYDENMIGLLQNYRAAFLRLAYYYAQRNQLDPMVEVLDKMERVMPEDVIPLRSDEIGLQIAHWYYRAERYDEFERRLKRILRNNPDNPTAISWLVGLYRMQQRYPEAIALMEQWLKRYPTDAQAQRLLQELRESVSRGSEQKDTARALPDTARH
jgi:hypothetical protein